MCEREREGERKREREMTFSMKHAIGYTCTYMYYQLTVQNGILSSRKVSKYTFPKVKGGPVRSFKLVQSWTNRKRWSNS